MTEHTQHTPLAIERNHAEALLDVLYGIKINEMSARLYRRIDGFFSLVNVAGGSTAFASVLAGAPSLAGTIGLIIAVLAYFEREIKPGQKAVLCDAQAERFGDLAGRAPALSLVELDRDLIRLQSCGPTTFEALRMPAYNDNVMSRGYPQCTQQLTKWQRLMHWLC